MESLVDGGYVLITVGELANVCAARKSGALSFMALRVWLATHEQRARRAQGAGEARYDLPELKNLLGESATLPRIARSIRELSAQGLITWSRSRIEHTRDLTSGAASLAAELGTSHKRLVPVPRRLLRALFRHKSPSEVMAAIAHLIRCLFKRGVEIANYGLVKASWVASVFGVAERSVHSARKWLAKEGFLTQEYVHQLVKNRFGAKFVVSLRPALARTLGRKRAGRTKSAPPSLTNTPYRSLNQYRPAAARSSGVCGTRTLPKRAAEVGPPTIRNILPEDLKQIPRLEVLYEQAVKANWLGRSEANFRNFVCAALRATRAGGRVGAIFVGIVRKGLWHHITTEQEERAVSVLRRYRSRSCVSNADAAVSELVRTVLNGGRG